MFRIKASVGVPPASQNHHDSSLANLSSLFRFMGFVSHFEGDLFCLFVYGFLIIPPVCSCFRMPGRLRARWWFWSVESVGVLRCRSDGTDRGRRSWTRPTSASSRRVSRLFFANRQFPDAMRKSNPYITLFLPFFCFFQKPRATICSGIR